MNAINKQISRAHQRIVIGQFFRTLSWCLFGGLVVSAIAIAIPKIWHLSFLGSEAQQQNWMVGWVIGGLMLAIIAAMVATYINRSQKLGTAVEVDERFRLKERLSSAMMLTDEQRSTKAGKALIADAENRAESLDVVDQFPFKPTRQTLLPLIPALAVALLLLVPNAVAAEPAPEKKTEKDKQVKVAIEEAKKKLKEKIKQMEAKGLKDASPELKSLAKKIDNLSKDSTDDKRDALVKLNDVKKQIEDRRKRLGGDSKEMKKQLSQLQKVSKGPAKKLSEAISKGEFDEAQKAIKDLVKKLKENKLSEVEQKQLAKNMEDLADQVKKMVEKHEQQKQELKKKLEKALEQGDMEKAAQLQQQLEKKEQQEKQMQKMQKMANKLKECSNCMKQGGKNGKKGQAKKGQAKQGKDGQPKQGQGQAQKGEQGQQQGQKATEQAIQSLEDMAEELEKMQDDLEELEDLEDIMQQVEQAKNECNGCEGQKNGEPKWQDWAKGSGRGGGLRDKQDEETGFYKSRVKGKLQRGQTVVTGDADGDNITGRSLSEARDMVQASINKKTDPLENQKLPRSMRNHARDYFKELGDQN